MKRLFLTISCDDITEVPDISSDVITILAPTDGVTLSTTMVTFNWNAVDNADNYELQIATPSFSAAQQIVVDSITTSLSITETLPVGDYEWQLRAENSEFQTEYTTQGFTIEE